MEETDPAQLECSKPVTGMRVSGADPRRQAKKDPHLDSDALVAIGDFNIVDPVVCPPNVDAIRTTNVCAYDHDQVRIVSPNS